MRGVIDGNPRSRHVVPLAFGHELVQRRRVPGDDGRRRTVLRSNGNRLTPWFDERVNPFGGPRDRDHATGSRDCADRFAPQRDDLRCVSQREGAGDVGRCDLALRVAEDGVRIGFPPPAIARPTMPSPQTARAALHRPGRGSENRAPPAHGIEQRPVDELGESRIAAPHLVGERRRGTPIVPPPCPATANPGRGRRRRFHRWRSPFRSPHSVLARRTRSPPARSTTRHGRRRRQPRGGRTAPGW